eukprot:14897824-Alexandrium_andersonii.AAC.1
MSISTMPGKVPDVTSAIHPRHVSAAGCLNPRSALLDTQSGSKRSELEPRGPEAASEWRPEAPE